MNRRGFLQGLLTVGAWLVLPEEPRRIYSFARELRTPGCLVTIPPDAVGVVLEAGNVGDLISVQQGITQEDIHRFVQSRLQHWDRMGVIDLERTLRRITVEVNAEGDAHIDVKLRQLVPMSKLGCTVQKVPR